MAAFVAGMISAADRLAGRFTRFCAALDFAVKLSAKLAGVAWSADLNLFPRAEASSSANTKVAGKAFDSLTLGDNCVSVRTMTDFFDRDKRGSSLVI